MRTDYANVAETCVVNIAASGSLSTGVNLGGLRLFGIVMPAAWTTANLTFQMSPDAGTSWYNMYDANGNELTAQAAANRYIILDQTAFAPVQWIMLRSGASASAVAQAASRDITLLLRGI